MAKVKDVLDGDTFITNSGEIIRLANVDAPETGRPYSRQATDHLKKLIEDKKVRIKEVATDNHGRTVADVSVAGKNVNRSMKSFLSRRRK